MKPARIYSEEKFHVNMAKLRKGGRNFEIVVDPDLAVQYKEGELIDLAEVVKAQDIFFDAKEGELASEQDLKSLFGTTDPLAIAKVIISEGEIQLTAAYREKLRQAKRNRIIDIIHRNAIDPKNGTPHPKTRIEAAFDETKVKVDEFRRAEDQVNRIVDQLMVVLPIKFAKKVFDVRVPPAYASRIRHILERYATIKKDMWLSDGSATFLCELPAGLQGEFIDAVNAGTKGTADFTLQ
ncbi:MAG: ribosome assembly factor SBDS [Candidatus Woesearchaeota archaeon]|nr:MAG: ribosome assembly factor SBDS [Candidatus Woesearchaeota archaeon]